MTIMEPWRFIFRHRTRTRALTIWQPDYGAHTLEHLMVVDLGMVMAAADAPMTVICLSKSHIRNPNRCAYISAWNPTVATLFRTPFRHFNTPVFSHRLSSFHRWSCFYSLCASCPPKWFVSVPDRKRSGGSGFGSGWPGGSAKIKWSMNDKSSRGWGSRAGQVGGGPLLVSRTGCWGPCLFVPVGCQKSFVLSLRVTPMMFLTRHRSTSLGHVRFPPVKHIIFLFLIPIEAIFFHKLH